MSRFRIFFLLLCVVIVESPVWAQELSSRDFLDGRIQLLMPDSFELMTDEMARLKYPNESRPTIIYTNPNGTVNVAVNYTQSEMPQEGLPELRQYMEQYFRNIYPTASWHRNDILTTDGHVYFILDLTTPAADTEIRNIMFFSSLDDRLISVAFNCTVEMEADWGEIGAQIINSIKVIQ